MKRFIGIMQFMTRIPINIDVGMDEAFHKGMIYFPIVGLVLGLLYYGIAQIGLLLFNPYLAAVLVVIGEVVLTGGLHLDGVGDTFDGLYSYRSKERILEIMKDSRLGTNALLAILLLLAFKLGLLYSFLEAEIIWPIILMPVVARTMQVLASYKTKTPRKQGMGNLFIGKVSTARLAGAFGLMFLTAFFVTLLFLKGSLLHFGVFILAVFILVILVKLFIRSVYKKIDGLTGDILGCICELTEVAFLVFMYLMYFKVYV